MIGWDTLTVAIASGKGGTGKTLVATGLAARAAGDGERVTLADCDVEAPNDHLFIATASAEESVVHAQVAEVDPAACDACGLCSDACAFGAVRVLGSSAIVFDELCHGCGVCLDVCPVFAVSDAKRPVGRLSAGPAASRPGLALVSGVLDIGQVKAPTVIRAVREAATDTAPGLLVIDAPPGVACSAVAAIRGADLLVLVTEPTPFGLHDLELSVRLGRDLGIEPVVVVNRDDGASTMIDEACSRWDVPIVARIPFSRAVAEAYARGDLAAETVPELRPVFSGLLDRVRGAAVGR